MSNNTIILKRSSVTGKKPTESQLQYGELSINYADGELYYKSSDNTIKAIGQKYGEDIESLKSGKLDANGTALKATSDASGNNIVNTYIKGLSVNGKVITYTKGNGDTGTITTQDTTYEAATSSTLGLVKVGSNITNTSGVISLTKANVTSALGYTPPTTDTTYSSFVGASASADGSTGLVPTPIAGKQGSFLRGDGTWATPLNTTYTGSDGISLSGTNFTNSGVRSIASGTTANTLSVNTGGTTKTITINNVANATNATNATKATQDSVGQQINTTYIKGLSVSGKTITYTKGDDTKGSITTQDTTYSAGTGLSLSGTTFTNSGVRSIKAGTTANQLSIDTNGTTSTITINNVANATTASSANALSTARTITLGGDLNGSVSFDGSENVTLTATVADDSHNHTIANIDNLQTTLNAKAPLASPTFTGTPKAPTATSGTNTTQIATTAFVQSEINSKIAAADAMIFKGTIGTGGTITALPATHTTGWTYKVITAGTYAGQKCEVGDLITCLTDGTTATDSHWTVIQTNIDGAVTGPTSSVANRVAVFDGTTGKIIKDSGYTIAASVPSDAKFTDTTYSVFTGATSSAAGSTGLVPSPASGKQTSFLRGDGTWVVPTNTTYSAGAGISLNGTTFSNSGVRSVVAGDTANVLKVNTNGTEASITINNVANATSATKATQDGNGAVIATTYAKLASPTLTGTPKAPTAAVGTNTTQIATTAFVQAAMNKAVDLSAYARLDGATFTGAVTTPNLTVTERAKMPTIVEYETDVTENYTINGNSMSGHYVKIADNVTVTIADGAVWSIG